MKDMLDKMEMPKKAGEDDGMLEYSEEDMEIEGEAPASGLDLSSVSDDELLMEMEKRGLLSGDSEEVDEEAMDEQVMEGGEEY